MGTTAHGLVYPEDYSERADVPAVIEAFATSIETALNEQDANIALRATSLNPTLTGIVTVPTGLYAGSAVNKAQLDAAAGAGAWTPYTPALSGITIGNGTAAGAYSKAGRTVQFRASFRLGSTSVITGNPYIGLPVALAAGNAQIDALLDARFYDDTYSGWWRGAAKIASSTLVSVYHDGGAVMYTTTPVTPTVPFTWAEGDRLSLTGTYEAAS